MDNLAVVRGVRAGTFKAFAVCARLMGVVYAVVLMELHKNQSNCYSQW